MNKNDSRIIRTVALLFTICSVFLAISCQNREQEIQEALEKIVGQKVVIPYDEMISKDIEKGRGKFPNNARYHLISFSDSSSCTFCQLKGMSYWKELLDSVNGNGNINKMDFQFILSPAKSNQDQFIYEIQHSEYPCQIFIDTCSKFLLSNPDFPSNNLLHTFLLDSVGTVILVGNPKTNRKIENLLIRELN